ncbi:MAG: hypothetical protein NVV66_12260 [Cellulomonas sp.]|uniref:hypothetical protein n=1 Tax=Cellulomonas sp. TaxID=40001 RepID=UPI00258487FC|nr:hypothetical protein [Cellulomonas sp.]MCR6705416.1 hypothetical protein [Cellulomonas sp.]
MTNVRAPETPTAGPAAPAAAGMRELTETEHQHLDRLRGHLASSGAPVGTLDGLGHLLQAAHTAWVRTPQGGRPDPGPMISSIAVGVGDLVLAGAPAARWVLHVVGQASPALLSADGSAAVVPFADLHRRWAEGADSSHLDGGASSDDESDVAVDAAWLTRYVTAAAAHLAAADAAAVVPTPRPPVPGEHAWAADTEAAPVPDAPADPVSAPPVPETGSLSRHAADEYAVAEPVPAGATATDSGHTTDPDAGTRRRRSRAADRADEPVMRYRTPTELPFVPSVDVQNLALRALDRGLSTALSDGPTPFAMRDDGTNVHVKWFRMSPDEALGQAERWVEDGLGVRAAIGWIVALDPDGGVAVPGLGALPSDESAAALGADHAVVVLASDARLPGLVVAHRYSAGPDAGPIGEPLIVGPCPTLL